MRVLLANSPARSDINEDYERFFVRAGSRWPFSVVKKKSEKVDYAPFPFFLAYGAALLEEQGLDVFVIDAIPMNLTMEEFIDRSALASPALVLLETSTPTIDYDLEAARRLREASSIKVALCGTHASVFANEIMERNSHVDFVLMGEYEFNLLKLARALEDKRTLDDIPGLAYRKKGDILVNTPKICTDSLDRLPFPARHLFPTNDLNDLTCYWDGFCQFIPAIQMHASRGCPFGCNFCLWPQIIYKTRKYRTFSAARVVDEMEDVINRYEAKEIYFDDDSFTVNKRHVLDICHEILRRGISIKWSCMGDAIVTDEEMIDVMARAGCIGMKFGVESGDPRVLSGVGKPVDLQRVRQVAYWCAERGIKTHATFTFGLLGETNETMERTLDYAKKLDVDSAQFSIAVPFPGTKFYSQLEKKGLLTTLDWEKFDGSTHAVFQYPHLTAEEIESFCKRAGGTWLRAKVKKPRWVQRQLSYLWRVYRGQGGYVVGTKLKRAIALIKS